MLTFASIATAATLLYVDTPDGAAPATTPTALVAAAASAAVRSIEHAREVESWDARNGARYRKFHRHRVRAITFSIIGGGATALGSVIAGTALIDDQALCVWETPAELYPGSYLGGCDGSVTRAFGLTGRALAVSGLGFGAVAGLEWFATHKKRVQRNALGPRPVLGPLVP